MRARFVVMTVTLVVLLVAGSIGCSTPSAPATPTPQASATPSPKPTTAAAPATTTAIKAIEWKLANYMTDSHHITKNILGYFAREAELRTGGRLKVTLYNNSTLGKSADQYDTTVTGQADVATVVQSFTPGRFPLSDIVELPFACPTGEIGTKAFWEVYKKGYFDKEFSETKVMAVWASSSYPIFFAKKRPATLAELKGLKVRSPGGYMNKTLEAGGITVVAMPATDMYTSMERGVVDGASISFGSAPGYKLEEVSKYSLDAAMGVVANVLVINKGSFAKLPKDMQDILDNLRGDVVLAASKSYDAADNDARALFTKMGCETYKLPETDRAQWIKATKPAWEQWVTDMNKKGLPGTAMYADFLAALDKLGAKLPF